VSYISLISARKSACLYDEIQLLPRCTCQMIGYYTEMRAYCMPHPSRFAVCGPFVISKYLANSLINQLTT
jgi:hypothetical protein